MALSGPVAQLGERLNGIQEVVGSIPIRSITLKSMTPLNQCLFSAAGRFLFQGLAIQSTIPSSSRLPCAAHERNTAGNAVFPVQTSGIRGCAALAFA